MFGNQKESYHAFLWPVKNRSVPNLQCSYPKRTQDKALEIPLIGNVLGKDALGPKARRYTPPQPKRWGAMAEIQSQIMCDFTIGKDCDSNRDRAA